jgi:hypothetical protein
MKENLTPDEKGLFVVLVGPRYHSLWPPDRDGGGEYNRVNSEEGDGKWRKTIGSDRVGALFNNIFPRLFLGEFGSVPVNQPSALSNPHACISDPAAHEPSQCACAVVL